MSCGLAQGWQLSKRQKLEPHSKLFPLHPNHHKTLQLKFLRKTKYNVQYTEKVSLHSDRIKSTGTTRNAQQTPLSTKDLYSQV